MAAPRMSRIVRLVLSALTAVIILATAAAPFVSPGIEARSKERRGHGHRHEQVQGQAKERGKAQKGKPQLASASKKRNTRKGNRIGNPRVGSNPSLSASNPNLPSADDAAIPPTLDESAPGLPDDYNTLYRTRTFQLSPDCLAFPFDSPSSDVPMVQCPNLLQQTFAQPTPVQIELIAPVPCGQGVIVITTVDDTTGHMTGVLAFIEDFRGGSTGVVNLGSVKNYVIDFVIKDYDGCGPTSPNGTPYTTSMTIRETTPNRNVILNP
jgi:hypothetical protein